MSNSALVSCTIWSPNCNSPRNHRIDRITPHCVVGQCSVEALGNLFANPGRQASSNYGIGYDGRVGLYVDEANRAWTSGSWDNDQRAVTIEVASDNYHPYAFNAVAYERLVELCADICRRNGKNKLLWLGHCNYEPAANEMLLTVHRWFQNTICPGDWLMARMGDLANRVNALLGSGGKSDSVTGKTVQCLAFDTVKQCWLPIVSSGSYATDTIGNPQNAMGGFAVHCPDQSIRYAAHICGGGWLPEVSGYNINDFDHGFAGDGRAIDCVIIFGSRIAYQAKVKDSQIWLPPVYSDNANYGDIANGFAGNPGQVIDELKIWRY